MKKVLLLPLAGLLLLGAGCAPSEEDFPIVNEPVEAFETSYEVCKDPNTGARIYKTSFSGDDSGWATFYDKNGKLLEETPEMGPGAMNNLKPQTQVEDCVRTTEDYFKNHVTTRQSSKPAI